MDGESPIGTIIAVYNDRSYEVEWDEDDIDTYLEEYLKPATKIINDYETF